MVTHVFLFHSGGTNPYSGNPSPASSLRMDLTGALAQEELERDAENPPLVLVSGEETRTSGPGAQAVKLAKTFRERFPAVRVLPRPVSQEDMFRELSAYRKGQENRLQENAGLPTYSPEGVKLHFVYGDWVIDESVARVLAIDPALAASFEYHAVPEASDPKFREEFSRRYQAGMSALMWQNRLAAYRGVSPMKMLAQSSLTWGGYTVPGLYQDCPRRAVGEGMVQPIALAEIVSGNEAFRADDIGPELRTMVDGIIEVNARMATRQAQRELGRVGLGLLAVQRKLDTPEGGPKAWLDGGLRWYLGDAAHTPPQPDDAREV